MEPRAGTDAGRMTELCPEGQHPNGVIREVDDGRELALPAAKQEDVVSSTSQRRQDMIAALIRSLGLGIVIAVLSTPVFSAGKTLSVTQSADLSVPPAKAWETIKNFDGWQSWHPAIASTDIPKGKGNAKGTVRVLTTKDGAKITEELLAHSEKSMTYKYRITDSPLPVTNYVSTIVVRKSKDGSTVVWSSSFNAKEGTPDDEAKKVISGIYTAGLDNLRKMLK
jgi:Polyketide cyclase / dehydrase and lipid transport